MALQSRLDELGGRAEEQQREPTELDQFPDLRFEARLRHRHVQRVCCPAALQHRGPERRDGRPGPGQRRAALAGEADEVRQVRAVNPSKPHQRRQIFLVTRCRAAGATINWLRICIVVAVVCRKKRAGFSDAAKTARGAGAATPSLVA
jgi:hypothetical protein